jgi:hypothetical protein
MTKYLSESDLEAYQAKWAKGKKPDPQVLQWHLEGEVKDSAKSIAIQYLDGTRNPLSWHLKQAKQKALRAMFDAIHKPYRAGGTEYMWFIEITEKE